MDSTRSPLNPNLKHQPINSLLNILYKMFLVYFNILASFIQISLQNLHLYCGDGNSILPGDICNKKNYRGTIPPSNKTTGMSLVFITLNTCFTHSHIYISALHHIKNIIYIQWYLS